MNKPYWKWSVDYKKYLALGLLWADMSQTSLRSREEFDPSQVEEAEFVLTTDDTGELIVIQKSLQS